MHPYRAFFTIAITAFLAACQQTPVAEIDWRAEVELARAGRYAALINTTASELALVHREYMGDRTAITFGTGADAEIRLRGDDIAPIHARFDTSPDPVRVHEVHPDWKQTGDSEFFSFTELIGMSTFGVGRYVVKYRPDAPVHGDALEIFDNHGASILEFDGIDFYEIDERWRVPATIVPDPEPQQIMLVDSHGQDRPYWVYGDLNFRLEDKDLALKLYATTLDLDEIRENGFQLMFTDQTSGGDLNETYPAGRYLIVDGQKSGEIVVDFNRAYNPPCAFSPIYTCPFPRRENHLDVAIRAGEQKYTGTVATPLGLQK